MYTQIIVLSVAICGALAAPSLVAAPAAFAAHLVAAPVAPAAVFGPPVVTSRSSQVISRNHNALAAPLIAAAPAAPIVASAPLTAAPLAYSAAPAFAYPAAAAPAFAYPAAAAPAYYF